MTTPLETNKTKKRGRPRKIAEPEKNAEANTETKKPYTYEVSIKLGNKVFTGEGKTVLEAITSVPTPIKIVSKGFLTLTNGQRTIQKMYMPTECKRLFFPNAQYVVAKQLTFLLK